MSDSRMLYAGEWWVREKCIAELEAMAEHNAQIGVEGWRHAHHLEAELETRAGREPWKVRYFREKTRAEKAEAEVERLQAVIRHAERAFMDHEDDFLANFLEHYGSGHLKNYPECAACQGVAAANPAARKEREPLPNGPPNVNEKQEV